MGRVQINYLPIACCDLYDTNGYIRTCYTYSPYGSANAADDIEQTIQWNSGFNDTESGPVHYNYRQLQ